MPMRAASVPAATQEQIRAAVAVELERERTYQSEVAALRKELAALRQPTAVQGWQQPAAVVYQPFSTVSRPRIAVTSNGRREQQANTRRQEAEPADTVSRAVSEWSAVGSEQLDGAGTFQSPLTISDVTLTESASAVQQQQQPQQVQQHHHQHQKSQQQHAPAGQPAADEAIGVGVEAASSSRPGWPSTSSHQVSATPIGCAAIRWHPSSLSKLGKAASVSLFYALPRGTLLVQPLHRPAHWCAAAG